MPEVQPTHIEGAEAFRIPAKVADRIIAPEREFETNFGAVIISGGPGSGTTATSKELAKLLGITKPIYHAGVKMRKDEEERTGRAIIGPHDREVSKDKAIDAITEDMILSSSTEDPALIEAQLGGWVAKKTQDTMGDTLPPLFKILLVAASKERYRRIQKREAEEGHEFTIAEIGKLTREREMKNRKAWRDAHPELKGVNPHSRENVDEKGEPIYDLVIDTTKKSIEEVVEIIKKELLNRKLIEKAA